MLQGLTLSGTGSIIHRDPHVPDARLTSAFSRFECDNFTIVLHGKWIAGPAKLGKGEVSTVPVWTQTRASNSHSLDLPDSRCLKLLVPTPQRHRLRYGSRVKGTRPGHHSLQVDNILRPFAIAWPDIAAVEHSVDIRSTLEKVGKIISQPDLWIAAITRAAGGILVTNNSDEFSRVPGLTLEDWLQS